MAKKAGSKAAAGGAKKAAGGKKKGGRKAKRSWKIYVRRALNDVNKKLTLSSKTSKIFNSFINDMFDRLATEAAHLARVNKKRTLGSREVQTAVRLTLPTELARHAMSEGTRAIAKAAQ
jgi:histone H2B